MFPTVAHGKHLSRAVARPERAPSLDGRRARAGRLAKTHVAGLIGPVARRRAALVLTYTVGLVVMLLVGHTKGSADAPANTAPAPPGPCQSTTAQVNVPGAGLVQIQCKWQVFLPGKVVQSSPNLAVLDERGPSVVVGSRDTGQVYALHLADGSTVRGWPVSTGYAVDSSPTVIRDPSGSGLDDVAVDAGDVTSGPPPSLGMDSGDVTDYGPDGHVRWSRTVPDEFGSFGGQPSVFASATAATLSGSGAPTLVLGGVSLSQYALDASTGASEPGWPRKTADSTFSTAAVADLVGGQPAIVAGSDSSAGPGALDDWNGGVVRAQDAYGRVLWNHPTDEVVTSSPAVGNLNGSGEKVVFGHGSYWAQSGPRADSTSVTALNADGSEDWQTSLSGYTPASPALADLTGNGDLDVVEPTWTGTAAGTSGGVYALDPGGHVMWGPVYQLPLPGTSTPPDDLDYGGVATADFGAGRQDVVYASAFGWNILDGETGQPLLPAPSTSANNLDGEWVDWDGTVANLAMANTPLVAPDPAGGIDIVVSGVYAPANPSGDRGFVAVYRVATKSASTTETGAWPMVHHDPAHSGSASVPFGSATCQGCGSGTSGGGYWLAGADGGVFSFGDARFYGSTGAMHLNAPVVGMAATPDGRGYWLVASDGGVFSFGDAAFYGSMGGAHLNAPVVGMAATADFPGYWLVASDGGVFSFGDATFRGSMGGTHLAQPVVGIAALPGDGGYWEIGADGGVFTFGQAPYDGSMGGDPLAAPVRALAAVPATQGGGYWEVGADGGIFTFGHAPFDGSMGGDPLAAPIVAIACVP
jgi:hypothetical protein